MSLSSLLKAGRGPVWDWFAANFPETQRVCTDANRALRCRSASEPCVIPPVPGTDHGLVGTAVGYLLSAHLRVDAMDMTVATHGAELLDGPLRRSELSPSDIERIVVERVRELQPSKRTLADGEWAELCRLVGILSRFEQYFRAGPTVLPYLAEPLGDYSGDLEELGSTLVKEPSLRDLDVLGRATIEDYGPIRAARELRIGPTFTQSLPLGGADADLVYDGTLIDLKSTSQAQVVGRHEAWQLLGYLLADTNDLYTIRTVEFAALRRRPAVSWSVHEFMDALAGDKTQPIDYWREEFAALLNACGQGRGFVARWDLDTYLRPPTGSSRALTGAIGSA